MRSRVFVIVREEKLDASYGSLSPRLTKRFTVFSHLALGLT